jgi:riboflavin kinase/FMN adenylyltransferase
MGDGSVVSSKTVGRRQELVGGVGAVETRRAMRKGRPGDAAGYLGYPRTVRAVVEHGDARGRTIGFPTANMHLEDNAPLAFGIYAVRVTVLERGAVVLLRDGVANFGIRPMFRTSKPLLEVHLFDFSGDLYGKELIVELVAWIRPEAKFDGLEALVEQIKADAAAARVILGRTDNRDSQ